MTNLVIRSNNEGRGWVAVGIVLALWLVPTAAGAETVRHRVRSGDCLSELAVAHGVTVEQLRRWNELTDDHIDVGQRLIVRQDRRNGRDAPRSRAQERYTVAEGDTLSELAERLGVDTAEILRLNSGLEEDHIEVGQRLTVPRRGAGRARFAMHRVKSGETLSDIARRYRVSVDELMSWNQGVEPRRLEVRQKLRVRRRRRRRPPSQSIGWPWDGRLLHGRQLGPHKGYVLRDRRRAWGTSEMIEALRRAFDEVVRRHPQAPRVRVHDLSRRGGGAMTDHRSHRSGRDVDLTYYRRRCPRGVCDLRPIRARDMAVAPQWTLFRHWLRRGDVQLIFVDWDLQRALYNHARRRGGDAISARPVVPISPASKRPGGRDSPLRQSSRPCPRAGRLPPGRSAVSLRSGRDLDLRWL